MSRMKLSRRAVLRGVFAGGGLAVLPLPRLAAMLGGNGDAYADGTPLRRVFGTWFYGQGVIPSRWIPAATGPNYVLSEQLAPFVKVKSKLTVISGMELKTGHMGAHSYGPSCLSGAKTTDGKSVQLPTIDQVIADQIIADAAKAGTKAPPLRSLELGVTKASPSSHGDVYFCSSFRGTNQPNFPDFDPASVYMRLFGAGGAPPPATSAAPSPADTKYPAVRQSVLDAVKSGAHDLSTRVGAEDKMRLEAHLDGIRSLEQRLVPLPVKQGATCQPSDVPAKVAPDLKGNAPPEVNKAMADLLVMALACELTQVFAFMFSYPAAHIRFPFLGGQGVDNDYHNTLCHMEADPQPKVNTAVIYQMGCFAYLLEQMDAIKEGATTLLDNSAVLTGTCVAWGKSHQLKEWPIMIGGRAGGALKGGIHHRAVDDNTAKVLLTLANVYGCNLKSLGLDPCTATAEVPEIRT
jgi:Protein of unknown function (DUF1552)